MYRELIEKSITHRGNIVPADKVAPVAADYARYCSLFLFGKDILEYVRLNKTVKGYKGKVYADAIWIDVDNAEDRRQSHASAIEVVRRLHQEYGVSPSDLFIYFSGNKGFHIAIHNRLIGFTHTDPISTDKVKDFVKRLTKGIPDVDTVIYEAVRIFRIANSRHEKTGLYKVQLSPEELFHMEIEEIAALAVAPRANVPKVRIDLMRRNEALARLWEDSGRFVSEQERTEIESRSNLFEPPRKGERNHKFFVQACTLFRKSELSKAAIMDIMTCIARQSDLLVPDDPHRPDELRRMVDNAERIVGEERKKSEEADNTPRLMSFGDAVKEWEEYTLAEETKISLLFEDINAVTKGRLKGKVLAIMGYGGSKKSLYALNVALNYNNQSDDVCIYSNMEMSTPQLVDRIIDYEVGVEGVEENASEIVAQKYKEDVNEGRAFLIGQLARKMGSKFQILANSRCTYDTYKAAIRLVRETVGNPGILVVDGLSMMGGKGTETELYSQNTADLKRLANEENIFIIVLCHVSKGGEKWSRDLSRLVRGSEKIMDNCDMYMTMSQIQDEENPGHYNPELGYVHFHDKRGKGKTVEVVYQFNPRRLKLTDSGLEPALHREPVQYSNAAVVAGRRAVDAF